MALQLFGVVRQSHPTPDARTHETGLHLVKSGDLAAAAMEIADPADLTEEDAARHLDVLIMLLRDGPVLPLAFGTVSPDESAVRTEVLDPVAEELTGRLAAADGFVEVRVDLQFDEARVLRELMQTDDDIRALAAEGGAGSGIDRQIALGELVSARLQEWRVARTEDLARPLAGRVDRMVELESRDPLQHRWAFLVRADQLGELDGAVGEMRAALGEQATVEYVGPLPVYSFELQPQSGPQARSAWGF